ncbi:mandelate racemase/muconate lactonizing enzyme family protein [Candidatus Bathyarchaeota archaeon]|nr:mandelate racemase/muconate lactonizing enzyme family protein [Candidatus Bathyarchaeota archaeon]
MTWGVVLRITKVEIIPVDIPRSRVLSLSHYGRLGEGRPLEFVLTRVHTDEGVTGLGECPPLPPLSPESQPVIVEVLRSWIVPNILGLDPFDLMEAWRRMDYYAPTYPMAKAAIDMALWDIIGKKLGLPLYRLLGGGRAARIPLVGLVGLGAPEDVVRDAGRYISEGYKGLRLKIGPGRDVECVRALREAFGGEVDIRVDCNQAYSRNGAVRVIRALERFDVELVEQPTPWWDFKALAEVAKRVETPIMPHESIYLISDVKALLDMGAIGVLGLKTYRPGGGVTSARRLLEVARVLNLPCLMHDDVELGVSLAAAAHIISAYSGVITHRCELSGYPEWLADDVVTRPMRFIDGYAEVPEGPGLGVELDPEKAGRYSKGVIELAG